MDGGKKPSTWNHSYNYDRKLWTLLLFWFTRVAKRRKDFTQKVVLHKMASHSPNYPLLLRIIDYEGMGKLFSIILPITVLEKNYIHSPATNHRFLHQDRETKTLLQSTWVKICLEGIRKGHWAVKHYSFPDIDKDWKLSKSKS